MGLIIIYADLNLCGSSGGGRRRRRRRWGAARGGAGTERGPRRPAAPPVPVAPAVRLACVAGLALWRLHADHLAPHGGPLLTTFEACRLADLLAFRGHTAAGIRASKPSARRSSASSRPGRWTATCPPRWCCCRPWLLGQLMHNKNWLRFSYDSTCFGDFMTCPRTRDVHVMVNARGACAAGGAGDRPLAAGLPVSARAQAVQVRPRQPRAPRPARSPPAFMLP
eukprot:COSAG01_NODE_14624_length_1430_cov_2.371150_1_plen_224_part_00